MQQIRLAAVKKGEYFKRSLTTEIVYVKGDYVRQVKKYSCTKTEDMNAEMLLKGDTLVYIGFTY